MERKNRNLSTIVLQIILVSDMTIDIFSKVFLPHISIIEFDRLFRTGDYGKLINGNCIQYEGRTDSQIKVRGNRVELLEIEKVLRSVDGVDNGIVLCYHAGKEDQAVLAFVVLKTHSDGLPSEQDNEIEKVLKTKIRDFEMPQILTIKSMPLLANGKIDRQALFKVYENRAAGASKRRNPIDLPHIFKQLLLT